MTYFEKAMHQRLLAFLMFSVLLISCSSPGADASRTVDISADRLAEIRAKPYTAGNNPGGFAAAALSNPGDDSGGGGVRFIAFGPYLRAMGFTSNMVITAIDVNVSAMTMAAGEFEQRQELWQLNLPN